MKRQNKTDKPRKQLSLDHKAVREIASTELEQSVGGQVAPLFSTDRAAEC